MFVSYLFGLDFWHDRKDFLLAYYAVYRIAIVDLWMFLVYVHF